MPMPKLPVPQRKGYEVETLRSAFAVAERSVGEPSRGARG